MPRGPLPDPNHRHRNAPTIPTTSLPIGGRPGPIPEPPAWVELGTKGRAWWDWAWVTPQASAWAPGHEVAIARRAALEDDTDSSPLGLAREMRELDDRFGLTPKGMAALRWEIVVTPEAASVTGGDEVAARRAEIRARATG